MNIKIAIENLEEQIIDTLATNYLTIESPWGEVVGCLQSETDPHDICVDLARKMKGRIVANNVTDVHIHSLVSWSFVCPVCDLENKRVTANHPTSRVQCQRCALRVTANFINEVQ